MEAGIDAAVEFADTHLGADPHTQYQKESEKGAAGGYASLDGSGKVPSAQIPDIAISEFLGVAADESAMLGAVGQKGDWVIRSDENKVYVITGADPSVIGGWTALAYPADAVVSVNGQTGAVSLDYSDVGAAPAVHNHDDAYYTESEVDTLLTGKEDAGAVATHSADTTNVHGIADTSDIILEGDARLSDARTPTAHNHDDIYYTDGEVDTLLSGKETAGAAASAVSAHEGAADPHAGYQKESEKGVADGYASLDSGGQVPAAQIPAIAITEYLGAAANQAAMLALVGQKGDWCTRTDLGTNWVITGNDPTQLASWTALTYPASPVTSVNSETGAVVLDATDVGAVPNSANAVTNTILNDMAQATIKGRASGAGTGDPTDLTGTQVAAILPTASSGVKGLVTPDGNTSNFLRGDGSFAAPAGSGGSAFRDTSGIPSSGTGSDGDFAWDAAENTRGAIYLKTSGTWAKVGFANREAAYYISQGWSSNYPNLLSAPSITSAAWSKSGLAAQSGTQVNFAGSAASAQASIEGPRRFTSASGYFTIDTMPVGGSLVFGIGMSYGWSWPSVTVSASGVVQIINGFGDPSVTLSGTAQVSDVFAVVAIPGATFIGWMRGNSLIDYSLFPAFFDRPSFYSDYGLMAHISAAGTLTAGAINFSNGIEVAL
jgi:hypothetical protein